MPIPALIGALGALAVGGLSHLSAKSQQNRAIAAQRSLQSMLLNNAGAAMARNAKQAGLSPAFAMGSAGVPTAPSVAAPSANFDSSGFSSLLSGVNARKLQKEESKRVVAQTKTEQENAKVAEEKAKQEAIITEQMQGKNSAANSYGAVYIDPTSKQVIEGLGDSNISDWLKANPGVAMPLRQEPVGYMGQLEFDNWLAEYEAQNSERSSRQDSARTQMVINEARQSQAKFEKALSEGSLSRSDVMDSILSMPVYERKSLIAQIEGQGLLNTWQDLQNKQARESSFGRLIDAIKDDSLSFGDKVLMGLTFLANTFIGNSHVNFNVGSSRKPYFSRPSSTR